MMTREEIKEMVDYSQEHGVTVKRREIGWYVLFILGPAVYIAPLVALFFVLYSIAISMDINS